MPLPDYRLQNKKKKYIYIKLDGYVTSELNIQMATIDRMTTIHAHNTRSSQKLFVQWTRTSAAASCIRHTGVKIWNKISTIILHECSLPTFKYCVRDYLLPFKLDW